MIPSNCGDKNIVETIINKSEKVKERSNKAKKGELTQKEKKELTDEEKAWEAKVIARPQTERFA